MRAEKSFVAKLHRVDTGLLLIALYGLVKLLAYAGWCWMGLRRFDAARVASGPRALALGFLRLLMGIGFGVLIFFASAFLYAGLDETGSFSPSVAMVAAYGAVYVPVRWIEWGLIEAILNRPSRGFAGFLLGPDRGARLWRLGGTLVSCLADVPLMLAAGGLPVGRFMC